MSSDVIELIWCDWLREWGSELTWLDLIWVDAIGWQKHRPLKTCSRRCSEHPNLQFRICLKSQPDLPCTSGVWCVNLKVPLLDSDHIPEGRMKEILPRQKWLISYLWRHFLVPEHQIRIWLNSMLLDRNTNSQKPYFRNADRTFGCLHLSFIS